MARTNSYTDSRFLLPDMFSFSFEPEILTFLWGLCAQKGEDIRKNYKYFETTLLEIIVPEYGQRTSFLNFLKYSVITGGTTLLVCCSSYGVFKFFQTLRHEGVPGIKKSWENAIQVLSRCKNVIQNFRVVKNNEEDLALVPLPDSNGNNQLRKRPSDLMLNGSGKTPTPATLLLNRLNNGNHVSGTNGKEDIASGDEGMGEVQGQYFGPIGGPDTSSTNTPTPSHSRSSSVDDLALYTPQGEEMGLIRKMYSIRPGPLSLSPIPHEEPDENPC